MSRYYSICPIHHDLHLVLAESEKIDPCTCTGLCEDKCSLNSCDWCRDTDCLSCETIRDGLRPKPEHVEAMGEYTHDDCKCLDDYTEIVSGYVDRTCFYCALTVGIELDYCYDDEIVGKAIPVINFARAAKKAGMEKIVLDKVHKTMENLYTIYCIVYDI